MIKRGYKNLRNEISLELVQVNVETAIESERCGDAGDNLGDEPVQVGEARLRNTKVLLADFVDSLVINLSNLTSVSL
jgi:hypothetical protein